MIQKLVTFIKITSTELTVNFHSAAQQRQHINGICYRLRHEKEISSYQRKIMLYN